MRFLRFGVVVLLACCAAGEAAPQASVSRGTAARLAFTDIRLDYDLFVAGSGGTERRLAGEVGNDQNPDLSPDRGRVVFSSAGDLDAISVEGSGRRRLTHTPGRYDFDPTWSPDGGEIAWISSKGLCNLVRESDCSQLNVMAVGTNAQRTLFTGRLLSAPAWSPDGEQIAFMQGDSGGLHIVKADGTEERRVLLGGFIGSPSWSPDARKIVVTVSTGSAKGHPYLAIIDVETGRQSAPLTRGVRGKWFASGDILFVNQGDLYSIRSDGSRLIRLTRSGSISEDWTGDSGLVVFARDTQNQRRRIFEVGTNGEGMRRMMESEAHSPSYSPDGDTVAFVAIERDAKFLCVMQADGGPVRRLAQTRGTSPTWSPNGRRLAFTAKRFLATIRVDGKGLRRIRGTGPRDIEPDWSLDGKRFAFTRVAGDRGRSIMRVGVAGGLPRLIRRQAMSPDWSPNGTRLAYVNLASFDTELWTIRADGRGARRLTRGAVLADTQPRWSPDGRWIAFVRTGYSIPPLQRVLLLKPAGGRARFVTGLFEWISELSWRPTPRAR